MATSRSRSWMEAAGALCCALALALGAYAAHGLDAVSRARIEPALLYLLLHGAVLVLLGPHSNTRWKRAALAAWLLGMGLFCGSLILSVLAGWPTTLAPFGGMLLIAGWILQGIAALRR